MPFSYYVSQWVAALTHGNSDAQEMAMYALRSHDLVCVASGYAEDFRWHVTIGEVAETINPRKKL